MGQKKNRPEAATSGRNPTGQTHEDDTIIISPRLHGRKTSMIIFDELYPLKHGGGDYGN